MGDVVTTNDSRSKVVGMGTIKVKIFDGVVYDVKDVPNFRRNFVSMNRLDILGCDFSKKNQFLEVSNGSLVIIKGRKKESNIYKMIRDTI